MPNIKLKRKQLERRRQRVRKRLFGTSEHPRLTVRRSLKHIYAQIIDDDRGVTVCSASTMEKGLRPEVAASGNRAAAAKIGQLIAERAKAKGLDRVKFDRNGRSYHGRIKALADAAREAGLKF